MHLNGKDIEKQCNRKCLINGRALYASKAVNHLSVSNDYGDVKEYIVSHVPQEEQEEICASACAGRCLHCLYGKS